MTLIIFLSILCLAYSTPIKQSNQTKGVYKVDLEHHPSLRAILIRNGTWAAYLSSQAAQLFKDKDSGTTSLIDYGDAEYLVKVSQGTPAQTFRVICDSGSSNYWLIDSSCTSSGCNGINRYKHNKFHSSKSSTFQMDGTSISIQYGKGSMSGYLATDVIKLAGVSYAQQDFALATQLSMDFAQTPIEGVLGLGWPSLAIDGVTPPMQNFLDSLDQPVFTMYLQRHHSIVMGAVGGRMTLGSIDTENCARTVNYVPINSQYYWQFTVDSWGIGSYSNGNSQQVIADTGTSLLIGPSSAVQRIANTVGAVYDNTNGVWTVRCSASSGLPAIVFTINGIQYPVPPSEYVIDLGLGGGNCVVSIQSMDSMGFSMDWILGVTFMRTYCGIFDVGNGQIGFAKAYN